MKSYERLSAQDAAFLASESRDAPMVIASLIIYDAKKLRLPDGNLDFPRIRHRFETAMQRARCLTRRLAYVPLFHHPVWVDAEAVELDLHLHRAALPAPKDDGELIRFVERIYSQPMPRNRPLWDAWVIEELSDDRFAILLRLHHSMVDGSSGLDLLSAIHDVEAEASGPGAGPAVSGALPGSGELLADELRQRLEGVQSLAADALSALGSPAKTLARGRELAFGFADAAGMLARRSPINVPSGGDRCVACFKLPVDELNAIRRNLGGTLNDVMLAIIAGGLRDYLEGEGHPVDELRLRAACPSNTRDPGQRSAGNHTSSFIVELQTHEPDALARYDAIVHGTRRAKESHQADAVQFAIELADRVAPELVSGMLSLSNRFQNLVISNMAGPSAPVHLLGCQALDFYPITLLLEGDGLAITVFSYDGGMTFTLCANTAAIPSLTQLQSCIQREFEFFRSLPPRRASGQ